MLNYVQRLTVVAMGIFLSSVIFPSSLTSSYHSIVYAAVISCGPFTDPRYDPCNGTYGNDNMKGDGGPNKINGLDGNDQLNGGANDVSNDLLHGGYGDDTISGGADNDVLWGSVGADSFKCGTGNDRIIDFNPSQGDTKSNDCESIGLGNATSSGLSNETLTGLPANYTLSANNTSSQ